MERIIDGWQLKIDMDGKFLRVSREKPNTHYIITILKRFAIDIELLKSAVDSLSEDEKEPRLLEIIKSSIKEAESHKFPWEGDIEWNVK